MYLQTSRLAPGFLSDRLTIARNENAICKRRSRMTYDPNFTGMNKCDVRILYTDSWSGCGSRGLAPETAIRFVNHKCMEIIWLVGMPPRPS
jgi:hypothetical protein